MVPVFPSVQWFEEVAKIAMADEGYRHFGRLDAIVGFIIGETRISATFDVFDIKDIHEATLDELRDADFVLELPYEGWVDLVNNIRENGKADLHHSLNTLDLAREEPLARNLTADGYRLDKFFRYNASLQRFFDDSAQVSTEIAPAPAAAQR